MFSDQLKDTSDDVLIREYLRATAQKADKAAMDALHPMIAVGVINDWLAMAYEVAARGHHALITATCAAR